MKFIKFFIVLLIIPYACKGYSEKMEVNIVNNYEKICGNKLILELNRNIGKEYHKLFQSKKCELHIFNEKVDYEKETANPWKLVEKTTNYKIYKVYTETKDEGIAEFGVALIMKNVNISTITKVKSKNYKTNPELIPFAYLKIDNYEEVFVKMAYDFVKIINEN